MAKYFFTNICRRRFILEYFGQIPKFFCCNKCDNCSERELYNYTDRVVDVLFNNKKFCDIFSQSELEIMHSSDFIQINKYKTIGTTISLENWKKLIIVNKKQDCIPSKYYLRFGIKKK